MSKGKKSKASVEPGVNWDEGLVEETISDRHWQASLVFLVAESHHSEEHLKALIAAADGGNRKKFCVIDKEKMLLMALEDAKLASAVTSGGGGKKSKQGSTAQIDKMPHVEVCHQVATCISSSEDVSPSLLARLLKYAVLKRRYLDISRREAFLKEPTEPGKGDKPSTGKSKKGAASGRTSKAGKKGKDTPAPDAPPSVAIPQKPPTDMIKRGEEDLNSKYINDEPVDGPSCYILLTGFTSVSIYKELASLKLNATALVKIKNVDILSEVDDGTALDTVTGVQNDDKTMFEPPFYPSDLLLDLLEYTRSSPNDSMLRDMAQLELAVTPSNIAENENVQTYGQQLFDNLAMRLYLLLDQYKQYQQYLQYLDVQSMPLGSSHLNRSRNSSQKNSSIAVVTSSGSSSLYCGEMSGIPEECCTLPLILNSMVEQVSLTLEETTPIKKSQSRDTEVSMGVDAIIASLKVSTEDMSLNEIKVEPEAPKQDGARPSVVLVENDTVAQNFHNSLNATECMKAMAIHLRTNLLSGLSKFLTLPKSTLMDRNCLIHMLDHLALSESFSLSSLRYALLLLSLEHLQLPTASTPLELSYHEYHTSKLLFDYPFIRKTSGCTATSEDIDIPQTLNENNQIAASIPDGDHQGLPTGKRNMEAFSVQCLTNKDVLLQTLQQIRATHPYLSVYHSHYSNCNVLIAHTGFDGNFLYKYDRGIKAASKVGFQNYLEYLLDTYGAHVDEIFKHEQQCLTESASQDKSAGESGDSVNGDGIAQQAITSNEQNNIEHEQTSTESAKLIGYDLDDTALVGKEFVDTVFTADGVQVHSVRYQFAEGRSTVMVFVQNGQQALSANLVWDSDRIDHDSILTNCNSSETGDNPDSVHFPSALKSATFFASLNSELKVSTSCYGSKADRSLPYLPEKPKVLDELSRPGSSTSFRSPSQQGASQKLSRKQQEQQQQLLEQQRLLDEQRLKDLEVANQLYQTKCKVISRNNEYQQLYATTKTGLHLHSQIVQDFDSSTSVSNNTSLIIRQSIIDKNKVTNLDLGTALSDEKQRCYLPNGNVVCYLLDGSITILCADGMIYRTALKSHGDFYNKRVNSAWGAQNDEFQQSEEATKPLETVRSVSQVDSSDTLQDNGNENLWLITMPTGEQYLWKGISVDNSNKSFSTPNQDTAELERPEKDLCDIPLPPTLVHMSTLHISKTTDPVTKEVYVSREDGVTLIYHSDGSHVVQFVDGTRCTVAPGSSQEHSNILIECPGFASVTSNHSEGKCTLGLPDSTVILCSSDGNYAVEENYGCRLDICADGKAECKTGGGQYILCHTGVNNVLDAQDYTGNLFRISVLGEASVDEKQSHVAGTQKPFLPKFFVIDSGGKCAELLEGSCVASVLDAARQDTHSAVVESPVHGEGICSTVMEHVAGQKDHQKPPYKESNIVPSAIRNKHVSIGQRLQDKHPVPRFGSSVGKGLMIGTYKGPGLNQALARSELIKYSQFIHVNPATASRQNILSTVLSFNEWSQYNDVKAVRSGDNSIVQEVTVGILGDQFETDRAKFVSLYDKAFPQAQEIELPGDRPRSYSKATKRLSQYELEETEALITALRRKNIPHFSISDTVALTNMKVLASKLACKPDTGSKPSAPLAASPANVSMTSSPNPVTPSSKAYNVTATSNNGQPSFPCEDDDQSRQFRHSSQQESTDKRAKTTIVGEHVHQSTSTSVAGKIYSYPTQLLELRPIEVDFGTLEEGCTYQFNVSLRNVGINPCRFKIKQPPPSTGIKVFYSPGQIAAGMCRSITVELFAMAVGVVGEYGRGSVRHMLEIISEMNTLHLPIKADVLTSSHASAKLLEKESLLHGVKKTECTRATRDEAKRPARVIF